MKFSIRLANTGSLARSGLQSQPILNPILIGLADVRLSKFIWLLDYYNWITKTNFFTKFPSTGLHSSSQLIKLANN